MEMASGQLLFELCTQYFVLLSSSLLTSTPSSSFPIPFTSLPSALPLPLSLPLPLCFPSHLISQETTNESVVNLIDCFETFNKKEVLDGNNKAVSGN